MILAFGLGLVATFAYGLATVLESIGARRAGASEGLDVGLLVRVFGQLPYLAGIALDLVGFAASIVALQTLPLFAVQALVAASVGVTAVVAALMGTKLGRLEWLSLAVLVAGLVLLGTSAGTEHPANLPMLWRWVLLGCAGAIGLIGVAAVRLPAPRSAPVLAVGAGLGFAVVAIAARTLVLPHPIWAVLADPTLWALAANGVVSMLLFTTALQRGAVTTVAAISVVVETVLPAAIGLTLLGDTARHGFAAVAAAGFVLAVAGALALARFTEMPAGART